MEYSERSCDLIGKRDMKKHIALLTAGVLLFLVLFAVFFEAFETEHDCSGEDCPVCAFLIQCENMIRTAGSCVPAAVCLYLAVMLAGTAVLLHFYEVPAVTLVTSKVRLND